MACLIIKQLWTAYKGDLNQSRDFLDNEAHIKDSN